MIEITLADPASPVILHVPHSSRAIPPRVRETLLIDDAALEAELDEAVDAATDLIAERAVAVASTPPAVLVNRLSRLVVDPERFPDGDPMDQHGRGAVYTRTAGGAPLREITAAQREALIAEIFEPYAAAMTELVAGRRARGPVVIIDLHSYPAAPSRFEDSAAARPEICLGIDDFHTPDWLVDEAAAIFVAKHEVALNTPYAGCYVPLRFYGRDNDVIGLMVEFRRDVYLDGVAPKVDAIAGLGDLLGDLIDGIAQRLGNVGLSGQSGESVSR